MSFSFRLENKLTQHTRRRRRRRRKTERSREGSREIVEYLLLHNMRTSCCLNLPPPTSNLAPISSFIPIKPPQLSLAKTEGNNWSKQCVLVGVVIGLQLTNSSSLSHHHHEEALVAMEIMMNTSTNVESNDYDDSSLVSTVNNGRAKWSEKRTCPPWRGSSLETIVPENLPRPAARRRYEAIRSNSKTAPPLSHEKVILRSSNNKESCFSM